MIPETFKIEIEDALLAWQDVTGLVERIADGTTSEGQIVPSVSISFRDDTGSVLDALIDPEINRGRARIRITEGSRVCHYLLEERSGEVERGLDRPAISGRAWAGILADWRPLTHKWPYDMPASALAAAVAHLDVAGQSGTTVPVVWLASLDPTIPGKRYGVTRQGRLEIVKEIAAACAAAVRVSTDGLGFEVFDRPARDLSAVADRNFDNGLSLSYEFDRRDEIFNAVRVRGEVPDYTRPTLPVIEVGVIPEHIEADGVATATASATVFDSAGKTVRHKAINDEAIDAGSYTQIPVSGCYSVQGVWLNTGTQESPSKGARVEPTGFTASTITVPDNATQLFIVSYTQAESVSWSLDDYQDVIEGETQASTGDLTVSTDQPIGSVQGVYRATDANRTGTNFYTGGSFTANTTGITLGISPGPAGTALIVDYTVYNGSPLSASISPSSSLCDPEGVAQTTIGSGTAVGVAVIKASALGQEGRAHLALTGDAVDSLTLKVDPATLKSATDPEQTTELVQDEASSVTQTQEDGRWVYYIETSRPINWVQSVAVSGYPNASVKSWVNDDSVPIYKAYLNNQIPNGTGATITYVAPINESQTAQEADVTATVKAADGTAVADNTPVKFSLEGAANGATLSADKAFTSGGDASVTLSAGGPATFTVVAVAGSLRAEVEVTVSDNPETDEAAESTGAAYGSSIEWDDSCNADDPAFREQSDGRCCKELQQDSGTDGSICGRRRLVDCDGAPLADKWVTLCGGSVTTKTDSDGWFSFCCGSEGTNVGTVRTDGEEHNFTFSIAPDGSESRGGGTYLECL